MEEANVHFDKKNLFGKIGVNPPVPAETKWMEKWKLTYIVGFPVQSPIGSESDLTKPHRSKL